jgi:hypothetical protein
MATRATHAHRSGSGSADLGRIALRALGRLTFAALVVFHAWVLGTQLLHGRAFTPETAVRWAVSALVLIGFRALGRRGLPLFSGRRAVVLWLLVILIHAHVIWTGGSVSMALGIPETIVVVSQITATAAALGVVLLTVLAAPRVRRDGRLAFATPVPVAGLPPVDAAYIFAPRPPPLA